MAIARGHNLTQALASPDPVRKRAAEEKYSEILQTHVRGDCIVDKFVQPKDVGKDDLDTHPDHIKPCRWEEMDVHSPGAVATAFGGGAVNYYMHVPRFLITYNRIHSFRLVADISDLLTYRADITQLYHDYLIKDIVDQRDRAFIVGIRAGAGTINDTTSARASLSGAVGYTYIGAASRTTAKAFRQALADTENNLPASTVLMNNSTMAEFIGPDHDAVGGTKAESIYFNGFEETQLGGLKLVSTVKNQLIPNLDGYIFTEPETLGVNEVLRPLTFVNRSEAWYVDMMCFMEHGQAFPNTAAFARFNLSGSYLGWATSNHESSSS